MTLPEPLQQIDRTYVRFRNRRLVYFAGCDYFRLASHPKVLQAAATALREYGLNVSASRMTTGNHAIYGKLESALARFFKVETATLASSGYLPGLMVAQALAGQFTHAILDERAHGCLVDAAQFLGCPILRFKHRDANSLAEVVGELGKCKPMLLTDGMFSHDGGIAPLQNYLKILPPTATLLLDDSHAAGVLGKNGRGTMEHWGIADQRVIQTITLSKGIGAYGGAVLGTKKLRETILAKSRIFTGNTPLPLPLAAASLQAVTILHTQKNLRTKLRANIAFVKEHLAGQHSEANKFSPIFGFIPETAAHAKNLKRRLLQAGIFPSLIKYPGGPTNGYFRFAISSEHLQAQLKALVSALI